MVINGYVKVRVQDFHGGEKGTTGCDGKVEDGGDCRATKSGSIGGMESIEDGEVVLVTPINQRCAIGVSDRGGEREEGMVAVEITNNKEREVQLGMSTQNKLKKGGEIMELAGVIKSKEEV